MYTCEIPSRTCPTDILMWWVYRININWTEYNGVTIAYYVRCAPSESRRNDNRQITNRADFYSCYTTISTLGDTPVVLVSMFVTLHHIIGNIHRVPYFQH